MMQLTARSVQPEWIPSFYFSEAYGKANATHVGGEWITIADEKGLWQIPLILRPNQDGSLDATTPYGYGGIYCDSLVTSDESKAAFAQSLDLLGSLSVTSLFLRNSPFLDSTNSALGNFDKLKTRTLSNTVLIEVNDSESAWTNFKGRARTEVRKACAHNLSGKVELADEKLLEKSHPFRRLYESTMNRLSASSNYYFNDGYYQELIKNDNKSVYVATVADDSGRAVSSALIFKDENVAHYHLSGTDTDFMKTGANSLLIWTIVSWADANGLDQLHLGGGVNGEDSLYKFKKSFGGTDQFFEVAEVVLNENRFEKLVKIRSAELGCDEKLLKESQYFPQYRAGIQHV